MIFPVRCSSVAECAREGNTLMQFSPKTCLVITDHSGWGRMAAHTASRAGMEVTHIAWELGDGSPCPDLSGWSGDYILCFKAEHILSQEDLAKARQAAINFHPAPPSLRGYGTYEVAVKESFSDYGVTCHHIIEKIDSGSIIKYRSFDRPAFLGADALKEVTAAHLLILFTEIVTALTNGESLPRSAGTWSGTLHRRKDQLPALSARPVTRAPSAAAVPRTGARHCRRRSTTG
jgi:methionyl-tRNA formyltransferase